MKFHPKKLLSILLSLVLAAGMASCQPGDPSADPESDTREETTVSEGVTDAPKTNPATDAETQEVSTPEPETEATASPEADKLEQLFENKTTLRFDENGEFRILILSDLHILSGGLSGEVTGYIRQLLEKEKPDLVILNGDNVADGAVPNEKGFERTLKGLANIFKRENVYWMHVFGNHDGEMPVTLEQQQAIYESFEHCLSKDPVKELTGVGNYVIPIYGAESDEVKFAVWGIDSNSYLSAEDKSALFAQGITGFDGYSGTQYDYIHYDQIQWYRETSELMEAQLGRKIPGLMAFHIPLQESYSAWMNREGLEWTGSKQEAVCASPYNSGFFEVLRQRGDIKAVSNGHDHVNDYMVEYAGIKLCYASTVSTTTYGGPIGARVFVIRESDPADVETYVSYLFEQEVSPELPALSGVIADFEGEAPTFTVKGFDGAVNDGGQAEVAAGKGKDGSNALAAYRTQWSSAHNSEITWDIAQPGSVGGNKYLVAWMDLATQDIDFRKAGFGLLANNVDDKPYRTDNLDTPSPFYYKAEGSTEWVTLHTGDDGCFGAAQNSSVKGYKGWFAFPLEYMPRTGGTSLNEDTAVTGIYFYFSPASEAELNRPVYIDHIQLVEDYRTIAE